MNSISSFLEKFKSAISSNFFIKESVASFLSDFLKVEVLPQNVYFKDGIIRVKADSLVKNEIYIKKETVLLELSKKLPGVKIINIQ